MEKVSTQTYDVSGEIITNDQGEWKIRCDEVC